MLAWYSQTILWFLHPPLFLEKQCSLQVALLCLAQEHFLIVFQNFDRVNALEWAPGAGGLAIAPCVDVKFVMPYVFAQGNRIAPFLPCDEVIDG